MTPRLAPLSAILALSLATLACGIRINWPVSRLQTIPTETEDVDIPLLADSDEIATVNMHLPAGQFFLEPGAGDSMIAGEITYNIEELEPDITIDGSDIRIGPEDNAITFDNFPFSNQDELESTWELEINPDAPMELQLEVGFYDGELEFGGLSLHTLRISEGNSDADISFSEPNRVEMDRFTYESGTSSAHITGLANTNAGQVLISGGAGDYTLDFSGDLQRDMAVNINTGVGNITIIIPQGVNAVLTADVSSVNSHDDWRRSGGRYVLDGDPDAPTITIDVNAGLGNLELRN